MSLVNWKNRPALSWLRRSDPDKRVNLGDTWTRFDNGNPDSIADRGHLFFVNVRQTVSAGESYRISWQAAAGYQLKVPSRSVKVSGGNFDIEVEEGATYSGGTAVAENIKRGSRSIESQILGGATRSAAGNVIIDDAAFGGNTGPIRGVTDQGGGAYIFDTEGEALFSVTNTDDESHECIITIIVAEIPEDEL